MANVEQFPTTGAKNSVLYRGHCIPPGLAWRLKKWNPGLVGTVGEYEGHGDQMHFNPTFSFTERNVRSTLDSALIAEERVSVTCYCFHTRQETANTSSALCAWNALSSRGGIIVFCLQFDNHHGYKWERVNFQRAQMGI